MCTFSVLSHLVIIGNRELKMCLATYIFLKIVYWKVHFSKKQVN